MTDTIAITGLVATDPRHLVTGEGLPITTFRLASTQRRFDRANQKWVDGDTNWYTISCFRQLAVNAAASVKKGERILVAGRLRIREWQTSERNGMTVDIEAESLGHDLGWGSSTFTRSIHSTAAATSGPEAEGGSSDESSGGGGDTVAGSDPSPSAGPSEPSEDDESRPMATLPF